MPDHNQCASLLHAHISFAFKYNHKVTISVKTQREYMIEPELPRLEAREGCMEMESKRNAVGERREIEKARKRQR